MRRATSLLPLALAIATLLPLRSDGAAQRVNMLNGIGLIDYTRAPNFKVGDWVRYRVTGASELGEVDDYEVTVLIGGEETFWGEDCFWVETWTEADRFSPSAVATMMSYAAFGDTAWLRNFQKYARKVVHEVSEDGTPVQTVMRRLNTFNRRDFTQREMTLYTDTLGTDTVHVPRGLFQCTKVLMRQGVGVDTEAGDSTVRNEVRENRTLYFTPKVPITSVAREDIENTILRKSWKVGESDKVEMMLRERALGIARLLDYGSGNLEPRMTPAYARMRSVRPSPPRTPARKSAASGKARSGG